MNINYKLFFSSLAIFSCAICFASNEESSAANQLIEKLNPINNLSANFEQKSFDQNNAATQTQIGTFSVTSDSKFIWHIAPPFDQTIISDGQSVKIYDPDLEQLTIKSASKEENMIPLLLFGGNSEAIISQYQVVKVTSSQKFILRPKEAGGLFEHLSIEFEGGSPTQLEIIDHLKQTTKVFFSKIKINQMIPSKLFELSVPEGTDIIDER